MLGTFVLRMAAAVMGNALQLYFAKIDREVEPLSNTTTGIITAIFFLPELFGSPLLGAWSDRYGRKPFIMIGPLAGAIAVQITALTTSLPLLAFTRFLEGLSTASAIPATLSYLTAITSEDESLRGRVMGFFEIATIGGTIAGVLVGGPLFDRFQNHAFTWDGAIYLASLAIFYFGLGQLRQHRSDPALVDLHYGLRGQLKLLAYAFRDSFHRIRASITTGPILRFVPAWLAINMVLGVWLNSVVRQLLNGNGRFPNQLLYGLLSQESAPGTQISLSAGFVMGLFALGVLIWSLLLGRFRRTSIMLFGTGGLFVMVLVLYMVNHAGSLKDPTLPIYLAIAAVSLVIVSGFTPAALTYLADVTENDPVNRGATMGLYTVLFGLGQFLGQLLGGPFADNFGFDGLLFLTLGLGLIALYMLLRLHRTEQADPAISHDTTSLHPLPLPGVLPSRKIQK